jgi:hypothetical protein
VLSKIRQSALVTAMASLFGKGGKNGVNPK